jgi:polysaccharide export outer membrane protein
MPLCRLVVLLLALPALAGCMGPGARHMASSAPPSDIDALMYGPAPGAPPVVREAAPVMPVRAVAPQEGGPYTLDTGDKVRVVVFGQDHLSNSYTVDAAGNVTLPLIGAVHARGTNTQQLTGAIAHQLKQGFIREPSVAVEVEAYRPFFVLGEVTYPGQYPFVPHMTVESAISIAGGFTPRASKDPVTVSRKRQGVPARHSLSLGSQVRPGDVITVGERWF